MAKEPENIALELLRGIRAEVAETRAELRAEFRSEINSLRAEIASDFVTFDAEIKTTRDQIVGLRSAVIEYPPSSWGTGF